MSRPSVVAATSHDSAQLHIKDAVTERFEYPSCSDNAKRAVQLSSYEEAESSSVYSSLGA